MIPSSNLRLLSGVNISPDNQHTLYFDTQSAQSSFFEGRTQHTINNMMVIKGGTKEKGVIKVEKSLNEIYNCNYLMFQNVGYSNKWFYAFIDEINYINDGNSEIVYHIDNLQTWFFEMRLEQCFVDREHTMNDTIGANLQPESLEQGEYIFTDSGVFISPDEYNPRICIGATVNSMGGKTAGGMYGNVYSGLDFHLFTVEQALDFIENVTDYNKADSIVSMNMVYSNFFPDKGESPKTYPRFIEKKYGDFDGYIPKNNKLYTHPYNYLYVTTLDGNTAEFRYEFFEGENCEFLTVGTGGANPSIQLIPVGYKNNGVVNVNERMSLSGFPNCAYNIDSFKAWLAQNGGSTTFQTLASAGSVVAGVALAPATGGTSVAVGAVLGGLGVASSLAQVTANSAKPPQARGNSSASDLYALKFFNFHRYNTKITREYAEIIDLYFTKYGYKTNKLKIPNISGRKAFNYVKTIDSAISGDLPMHSKQVINSIFNGGVTFWKSNSNIGNYNIDNTL